MTTLPVQLCDDGRVALGLSSCVSLCGGGGEASPCCDGVFGVLGYFVVEHVGGTLGAPNATYRPVSPSTWSLDVSLVASIDAPAEFAYPEGALSYIATQASAGLDVTGGGELPLCRAALCSLSPIVGGDFDGYFAARSLSWDDVLPGPPIALTASASWNGQVRDGPGLFEASVSGSGSASTTLDSVDGRGVTWAGGRVAIDLPDSESIVVVGGSGFVFDDVARTAYARGRLRADFVARATQIGGVGPGVDVVAFEFGAVGCAIPSTPALELLDFDGSISGAIDGGDVPNNPASRAISGSVRSSMILRQCATWSAADCAGEVGPCVIAGAPVDPRCCTGELPVDAPECQPVALNCCPTPSGYGFDDPAARLSLQWEFSEYSTGSSARLLKRWQGRVRGLLDAPGCLGATFGASLTNLVALDEDNYADILTYPSSGFPTQTAHAFSLQAFMGHNAAFGSQGSRLLLNLHNGPTTGSSIYCQLLLTSAGALTLPIRGNPCPPLRTPSIPDGLVPTSGVFQPPGAAAPFVTGYYAELTTQGGLYNNRYAAFVAASVETFRYAPCPEPSAALADDESPALRAARREFARQLALATCFGCGDSGEGLA